MNEWLSELRNLFFSTVPEPITEPGRDQGIKDGYSAAKEALRTRTTWPVEGNRYSVEGRWIHGNLPPPVGTTEGYETGWRLGGNEVANRLVYGATGLAWEPLHVTETLHVTEIEKVG